eukprot:2719405-Rhodomonas_salina.1
MGAPLFRPSYNHFVFEGDAPPGTFSANARAITCPVLTARICLCPRYGMSGTNGAYVPMRSL